MELYSYYIWDKKSTINDLDYEYWVSKNPYFEHDEVVVIQCNSVVKELTTIEAIRSRLYLDANLPNDEVAGAYLYNLNNNLGQEPDQVKEWKAKEIELSQAKFILMKEGLL